MRGSCFRIINLISLIVISSLIAGCSSANTGNTITANESNKSVEEKKEAVSIEYPLTLKVGYSTNSEDPRGVAIQEFKDEVERNTLGNILVEIYPSGELGSDSELIAGMITGDVDMTVSSAGNYATYATKIGVSALPFLFDDFYSAWKFVDSDIMQSINKDLEKYNMHVLSYFDNGFRCVTTSKEIGPIESVSDMEGLNIRTPDNQIVMETMSQLQANPRSFPFAQLKDALVDGTFDAQENPIPVIYNNKLYEVQDYLSITNHSYDAMPFTIRQDLWEAFLPEYQEVIENAAKSAGETNRDLVQKQTNDYVALLEEEGMVVSYPDLKAFKEATNGVMDVFYYVYGPELISYINNLN